MNVALLGVVSFRGVKRVLYYGPVSISNCGCAIVAVVFVRRFQVVHEGGRRSSIFVRLSVRGGTGRHACGLFVGIVFCFVGGRATAFPRGLLYWYGDGRSFCDS